MSDVTKYHKSVPTAKPFISLDAHTDNLMLSVSYELRFLIISFYNILGLTCSHS